MNKTYNRTVTVIIVLLTIFVAGCQTDKAEKKNHFKDRSNRKT